MTAENSILFIANVQNKGKAISVRGCRRPQSCEPLRLPHFIDDRLTDGGKVVSLTSRPLFTTRKIPGTHFC
jgi:hypothetical protein